MKTYGLLGRGIGYSLSPYMHNAAFNALNINAEYKIFDLAESDIQGFFSRMKKGEISGCNVTIPYKEKALGFVNHKSFATASIGALNTVLAEGGTLEGHNTDYLGFMKSLTGKMEGDLGFNPEKKNIFIFGAGGAAKAILYVLANKLAVKKIIISDIDVEKAENLAAYTSKISKNNITISVAEERSQYDDFIASSDLLINATPSGMKETDAELFDYRYIEEKHHVFDLIYSVETPLIKKARSKGAKSIDGLNMLLYQAEKSFECWTGKIAPLSAMRKALLENVAR